MDLYVCNYLGDENILYQNSGAPTYTLIPVSSSAVLVSGNSVGSAWGDIDNDGDLDLFVCDDGDKNHLFINSGPPSYVFIAMADGQIVNDIGNSFGCVFGDYDNDGYLDLFVANRLGQQNFLYHNDGGFKNWITIKCNGVNSNKAGIGTRISIKATINGIPTWQLQEVSGQTGYNSQNLWLHFGLNDALIIDTLLVQWSSGLIDTCINVGINSFYTATEGECLTNVGVQEAAFENKGLCLSVSPNPAEANIKILYKNLSSGFVKINIVNSYGKKISNLLSSRQSEGIHEIVFDTRTIPSGIYFCQISCEGLMESQKILIINK